VKTRQEQEVNQQKKHEKEQEDIKHLKEFISSCGTYSNLVKQAQSKQKIIDKMMEAGLTPKVVPDPVFRFRFPNSGKLPPYAARPTRTLRRVAARSLPVPLTPVGPRVGAGR
jgi:ATP-binding cassette subfamily F protein 2